MGREARRRSARPMRAPHGALVVVWVALLAVQGCAERADREVFNLDDLGEGAQVDLLQDNDTAVNSTSANSTSVNDTLANKTFVKSNVTEMSSNSSWNPKELKHPFHRHMKANEHMWQKMGGWNTKKEKVLQAAKQKFKQAQQGVLDAMSEREVREMGCPCPGEKYYELVHTSVGPLSASPNMSDVNQTEVADMLNSTNQNGTETAAEKAARKAKIEAAKANARADSHLVKKMKKKYGKPGPNSSWQRRHDIELKRARINLKNAKATEDAAFKTALPEFQKMKEEDPAFFTNGNCQCPETWTKADAATLAAKEAKDREDEYYKLSKEHRKMLDEMSGASERLAKQEEKAAGQDPEEEKHEKKMASTPAPSGTPAPAPPGSEKH